MGDAPDSRDQRLAALKTWFHVSNPDGPIVEADVQVFLDEIKELHYMDTVAAPGRAASIVNEGYTSAHAVAVMNTEELVSLGFVLGNAKRVAMYLGSRPREPSPARQLPLGPLSLAASQQNSTQIASAVAMAVTTAQTKIKLADGSTSNVTVSAALKWARKHLEKTNISGYGTITIVLQMLIDDMTMDIVPHIIAEPVTTDDKSYIREVFASLTPEQVLPSSRWYLRILHQEKFLSTEIVGVCTPP